MYAHRLYHVGIVPYVIWKQAVEIAARENFTFTTFMLDIPGRIIRLDEAPDFDTAREPHVGKYLSINFNDSADVTHHRIGSSNAIWHHKWLWVKDNYTRFDVNESYEWSKAYAPLLKSPSEGSRRLFAEQLSEIGLG